ncbi:hypothetical protein GCM10009104_15730 [Marinobacterium maritimum]|uniref:Peptidase U49 n=2 Tax=Marinobacterium maritimum TaxID=500162 RepID=A0ABP3TDS2_9GAMM
MHLKAVESGLLNREIDYDNGGEPAKGPHADLTTKKIYLQEAYLEHLWAFIYSVFVIYEEGVQKPIINNAFTGVVEFNTEILRRAKQLYDWSISLAEKKTEWDRNLPNPQSHSNDREKFYAEKVNGIFQKSVSYVLFHEFCHLTQGHESYYLGFQLCNLTEADYADRIQLENEADEFAFNMIVGSHEDEKNRWVNGLSILFVKCSSLLLTRSLQGVKQRSHPDLDTRIHTALARLDLKSEQSQFYCWYLCCLAVNFYLLKHGITRDQHTYDTAEECFFAYLNQLDSIKFEGSI